MDQEQVRLAAFEQARIIAEQMRDFRRDYLIEQARHIEHYLLTGQHLKENENG
jgi:hypothetical protein